jgi:hypothetical protein
VRGVEEGAERGRGGNASCADEQRAGEDHRGGGKTKNSVLQDSRDESRPILRCRRSGGE